jgi:hypothetical protein
MSVLVDAICGVIFFYFVLIWLDILLGLTSTSPSTSRCDSPAEAPRPAYQHNSNWAIHKVMDAHNARLRVAAANAAAKESRTSPQRDSAHLKQSAPSQTFFLVVSWLLLR